MTPDWCADCEKGTSCATREERDRYKGEAKGEGIKATNWRRLGEFYKEQGKHELAQSYFRIADFDLNRSRRLLKMAEEVVKDRCPISTRVD